MFTGPISDLGINVNSCSHTTAAKPGFCPVPQNGTYLDHGYEIKTIPRDGNEPFGGYDYIVGITLKIVETGVFDPYMDPNGPVPCETSHPGVCASENWYQANVKKPKRLAGFLATLHRHEGMGDGHDRFSGHAIAAEGAYLSQFGNINRTLEGLFQPGSDPIPLYKIADTEITKADDYIYRQSNDCAIHRLTGPAGRWTGDLYFWQQPPKHGHGRWVEEPVSVTHCP
jgi:hypothetical protein